MEIANWFVIVMGLATVFFGLICIIVICSIMGALCRKFIKEDSVSQKSTPEDSQIPDKQKIIAGVCAAIAEELGTDVNAIKVVSFKKV